ncbi:SoxR reducing system RseC family protein [Ezakiella peruensis]|uniref:SoxR reducing system RseC family protein n=1 Tax=Ezakiella peruensis TaxID=1464038 RepID=UPI000C1B4A2E|nr:SoxR reducing system RseC family protein [Ezakiella peruensis]
MQVIGKVLSTSGNKAFVSLVRTSACGGNCKACGGGCETVAHTIEVMNSIDAKAGEMVEVVMDDSLGLKASAILYAIPFLGFVIGILLGYVLKLSELKSFFLGVLGIAISYLCIYFIDAKNKHTNKISIIKLK